MLTCTFACLRKKGDAFVEGNTSKEVLLYGEVCVIMKIKL